MTYTLLDSHKAFLRDLEAAGLGDSRSAIALRAKIAAAEQGREQPSQTERVAIRPVPGSPSPSESGQK